ncbi:unnamed protein product [Clonostachys rosea f. rosea IK726]|uniref:Uncharacterized protein n=1 Tax=Clonostachys rosea f. rosea IK726 TaxID=1349383 RepID=A0ACA9UD21_BIOOC|nr:unnamed protein product [Clonostachys rosea f. rosea IK726]
MRGSISTAEVLVEAGANPWKICASTGLNSVMAAVEQAFTWGTIEMITQNETYPPQWKYALKHGETLLHIAARVGNCDCLEVLLDKGIAGHSQTLDNDNSTPMHYAAEYGHTEAIRILAQREGDANAKTIYGFTPLHVAVKHGQTSTVRVLLEMGAKQFECSNGCTPLAYAYTVGNLDVIEMLTTEANVVQSAGLVTKPKALLALASALRDSVMNDDHVSCERLKNLGCPLDVDVEFLPYNILFKAIDYREHGALNILLEEDFEDVATINTSAFTCPPEKLSHEARSAILRLVNKRDETEFYEETPLIKAVSSRAVDAVELLIQAGADVDFVDGSWGNTVLHFATFEESVDIVRLILDSGCLVNVRDMKQRTALDYAFSYGNLDIARLLIQAGAQVSTESIALFGHRRSLAHLFNHDDFRTSRSLDLQYPLHIPITMKGYEISNITANIPILSRYIGDAKLSTVLNFNSSGKHSVLCQATMLGLMQEVELLVDFGADINYLCEDHGTPLTAAARFQRLKLFKYLFRNGASMCHGSKPLSTVLSNANGKIHPTILHWVLVAQHTEQRRITYEQLDMGENITGRWAGVKTAAIRVKWEWKRCRFDSSFEYACRLQYVKKSLRGKVVSPLEVKL